MTTPPLENMNAQTIIIYKTYTPQRQAYALTYYQQNKEKLKIKQRAYYQQRKEELKQDPIFKEKTKLAHEKYMNKIKNNPEKLEKYKQQRKEYYDNKVKIKND